MFSQTISFSVVYWPSSSSSLLFWTITANLKSNQDNNKNKNKKKFDNEIINHTVVAVWWWWKLWRKVSKRQVCVCMCVSAIDLNYFISLKLQVEKNSQVFFCICYLEIHDIILVIYEKNFFCLINQYRLKLCKKKENLFHPHPWWSTDYYYDYCHLFFIILSNRINQKYNMNSNEWLLAAVVAAAAASAIYCKLDLT